MTGGARTKVAVIGSGNIGTDLMIKILRLSDTLEIAAMAGIDPDSDGLARARRLKVATTHEGVEGLVRMDEFADVRYVFDATSAGAHRHHDEVLRPLGRTLIDLTPAALGPYVVPPVNGDRHLDVPNVNMVTCGGQATIPVVAAIGAVTPVHYGEI
ncbi:acetaldehyde dehydrogenase (acetylating), partial [Streptomyces sp. C1-2]|nr:acetaldehyde dehydrogenase (acetylating) [Streptomyces sp. C1-2]